MAELKYCIDLGFFKVISWKTDPWNAKHQKNPIHKNQIYDKLAHAFRDACLVTIFGFVFYYAMPGAPLVYAFFSTIAFNLLYEIKDGFWQSQGDAFSMKDFVAGIGGSAVSFGLIAAFTQFVNLFAALALVCICVLITTFSWMKSEK